MLDHGLWVLLSTNSALPRGPPWPAAHQGHGSVSPAHTPPSVRMVYRQDPGSEGGGEWPELPPSQGWKLQQPLVVQSGDHLRPAGSPLCFNADQGRAWTYQVVTGWLEGVGPTHIKGSGAERL